MVYVVGIIGFICGFLVGQYVLLRLLSGVPNERLLQDKMLRLKYGIINWLFAGGGAAAFVYLYRLYFEGY